MTQFLSQASLFLEFSCAASCEIFSGTCVGFAVGILVVAVVLGALIKMCAIFVCQSHVFFFHFLRGNV